MRRICAVFVGLILVAGASSYALVRAEPAGEEDVLGRVGGSPITRAEFEGRPDRPLVDQAWAMVVVHLADEARIVIEDPVVENLVRTELDRLARQLSEISGRERTAEDALAHRRLTRRAFEQECRYGLVRAALARYARGGRHAFEAGWQPQIDPDLVGRAYDLAVEQTPGYDIPFDEDRGRIEGLLNTALGEHAVARLVLEVAREPGFIAPDDLAGAVQTRAIEVGRRLEAVLPAPVSNAPPLPASVFSTFDAALAEAAATGCLLYLHVDPVPDDAKRLVSDETIARLAKRYVVAVVSGRIGERAADRLRLRYGLMRPGAMSVAITPSGTLLDMSVPFDAAGAEHAMEAAARKATSAPPCPAIPLCTPLDDEQAAYLWFEPMTPLVGTPVSLRVQATNDTTGPIDRVRATVLVQGPGEEPRLVVLTVGEAHVEPGYDVEARHELRPRVEGWLHALAVFEGGGELRRGVRARVYVR